MSRSHSQPVTEGTTITITDTDGHVYTPAGATVETFEVMSFDGVSYVNDNTKPTITNKATICGWLKVTHNSLDKIVYSQGSDVSGSRIVSTYVNIDAQNKLSVCVGSGTTYNVYYTISQVPNNVWFRFAVTYDISSGSNNGTNFKLYINQIEQSILTLGSGNFTVIDQGDINKYIGTEVINGTPSLKFTGLISKLYVSNTVISLEEIDDLLGVSEPIGTNSIGWYNATQIDGPVSKGALFNGINSYLKLDNLPTIYDKGTLSFRLKYVKPLNTNGLIYAQGVGINTISARAINIRLDSDGKIYFGMCNGNSYVTYRTVSSIFNDYLQNMWFSLTILFDISVVGAYDIGSCSIYLNGSRYSTEYVNSNGSTFYFINASSNDTKWSGASLYDGSMIHYFNGSISDILVSTSVLNQNEIIKLVTVPTILDERIDVEIPQDYEFLETFTQTGNDVPNNNIDGTLTGSGWFTTAIQKSFPVGNSSYNGIVRRYNSNGYKLNKDYSMCCWFKAPLEWNITYTATPYTILAFDRGLSGSAGLGYLALGNAGTALNGKYIRVVVYTADGYAAYTSTNFIIPNSIDITKWHCLVYMADDYTNNNANASVYLDGIKLTAVPYTASAYTTQLGSLTKNISFGRDNGITVSYAALYYKKLSYQEIISWCNKFYEKQIGTWSYAPYRPSGYYVETFTQSGTDASEHDWNVAVTGGQRKYYPNIYSSDSALVRSYRLAGIMSSSIINTGKLTYSFWIKYKNNSSSGTCFDTFLINNNSQPLFYSGLDRATNYYYITGTAVGGGQTLGVVYNVSSLLPSDITNQWIHIGIHIPSMSIIHGGCELYINGVKATSIATTYNTATPAWATTSYTRIGGYATNPNEITEYVVMPESYTFNSSDFISMSKTPPYNTNRIDNKSEMNYLIPVSKLIRLKEAEVSMLCIDGSDGKGNNYKLTPIFNSYPTETITWVSSNNSIATVDASGNVSGVFAGDVWISCTYKGITKKCLFTIYSTLPNFVSLYSKKGGNGLNQNDSSATSFTTFSSYNSLPSTPLNYTRAKATGWTGTVNLSSFGGIYDGAKACVEYQSSAAKSCIRVYSGSTLTDYFFGSTLSQNSKYDFDIGYTSEGYRQNGTTYSSSSNSSSGTTIINRMALSFSNLLEKTVLSSYSSAANTEAQLGVRTNCDIFYIPQNYVRYTTVSGYNKTVIFNMGSMGKNLNLICDNTKFSWFKSISRLGYVGTTVYTSVRCNDGKLLAIGWVTPYIMRSTDNGANWSSTGQLSAYSTSAIKTQSGRILVTKADGSNQLMYSDTNGDSWGTVGGLFFYQFYLFQASSGRIFLSSYNNTNITMYSDNDGSSWTSLVSKNRDSLIVQLQTGRLIDNNNTYSDDNGVTWNAWTASIITDPASTRLFVSSTGTVICFTGNAIHKSTDNGATWNIVYSGALGSIVIVPRPCVQAPNGTMYACGRYDVAVNGSTEKYLTLISTDDGDTWQELDHLSNKFISTCVIASDGSPVFISSSASGDGYSYKLNEY